jgi:hypothetical protein
MPVEGPMFITAIISHALSSATSMASYSMNLAIVALKESSWILVNSILCKGTNDSKV